MTIPSRLVHLPLAFDDSQTREAVERYVRTDPQGRAERRGRHEHRLHRPLQRLRATARSCTRRCSPPSSGRRSSASSPGCRSCSRSTRATTVFVPKYNPTRTWTPEGARRHRRAVLSRSTRSSRPAATSSFGRTLPIYDLRQPQRGLPRQPAAAARGRPGPVPPRRGGRAAAGFRGRPRRPLPLPRSRTARSTSAPTSTGCRRSPTRRRSGGGGARRRRPRRRCHELGRGHRGRHPDDRPGLPGPARDARAGLLPGRPDGPLRPPRGEPARRQPRVRGRRSRSRSATSRCGSTQTRRSRSAAPRRRSTVDGEPSRSGRASACRPGAELAIGIAPGPGFRALPRALRRHRRAAALRLARDLHDGRARRPRGPGAAEGRPPAARRAGRATAPGAGFSEDASPSPTRASGRCARCAARRRRPDYLTEADMESLFGRAWPVDRNSNRTGIRLESHRFDWARAERRHRRRPPVQHPRQQLPGRRDQRQRRPAGDPRAGRADGRRLRRRGDRRPRRFLEDRPVPARRRHRPLPRGDDRRGDRGSTASSTRP